MLDVPEVPTPPPTKLTLKERVTKLFFPAKNQKATQLPDEVVKSLEIPPINKQELTKIGFGRAFQEDFSTLSDSELPLLMEAEGVLGIVGTNEMISDETVIKIRNAPNAPNGYIFGAGFGNIVSMILLYPEGVAPKAICAVDVIPDPVVAGRMLARMMGSNQSFSDFKKDLINNESLDSLFTAVINEETNLTIKSRFQKVSLAKIKEEFSRVIEHSRAGWGSFKNSLVPNDGQRIDGLAVIEKQYDLLHRMAVDNNIGIAYADMTSSAVLEKIKNLPDFSEKRNIIYMSNIIDHLTLRGTNLSRLNSFDGLKTLGEEKNWFVDTTQNSLDYNLRVSNKVPQYSSSDVKMMLR